MLSGCSPIVVPPNDPYQPPVINIVMEYVQEDPSLVQLDVSGSTDPDPYGIEPKIVFVDVYFSVEGEDIPIVVGSAELVCFYERPAYEPWRVTVTIYDNDGAANTSRFDCWTGPDGKLQWAEVPSYSAH